MQKENTKARQRQQGGVRDEICSSTNAKTEWKEGGRKDPGEPPEPDAGFCRWRQRRWCGWFRHGSMERNAMTGTTRKEGCHHQTSRCIRTLGFGEIRIHQDGPNITRQPANKDTAINNQPPKSSSKVKMPDPPLPSLMLEVTCRTNASTRGPIARSTISFAGFPESRDSVLPGMTTVAKIQTNHQRPMLAFVAGSSGGGEEC